MAAKTASVALWEVPDTDHCGAISTAPKEFEQRLVQWFADHYKRRQSPS